LFSIARGEIVWAARDGKDVHFCVVQILGNKREVFENHRSIRGMSRRKDKAARLKKEEPEIPNAFGALGALDGLRDLPAGPEESLPVAQEKTSKRGQKKMSRGRVDIVRQTAHRGGKAVIVVKNFTGIGLPEKKELAKMMRKGCGVGGTVKDGCIEIQGDNRDEVKRILTEAGFNPVFAGG
jgi:translation initiation factor 1